MFSLDNVGRWDDLELHSLGAAAPPGHIELGPAAGSPTGRVHLPLPVQAENIDSEAIGQQEITEPTQRSCPVDQGTTVGDWLQSPGIQCTAIVTRMFNLVHTLPCLAKQLQLDLVHKSFSLGDEVSV